MFKHINIKGTSLATVLMLTTLFTTLQSSSCSKKDDVVVSPAPISGTWRVSLYWDKKDETSNFSGYSFSFNSGGQLVATKGSSTITGTWSESATKLIIDFGTTAVFNDINDDWQIVEKTATSIKLKDDNPLQDDQLHFVKN
jgi:hypothetical protein